MNKQENYRMEEKDAIGIIAYIISIINKEMLDTYGSLLQMNVFFKKENGKMLVLINDKIAFQRNKEEKIKEVVEQLFYKYYNNVEAWLKNKEWDDFLDPDFSDVEIMFTSTPPDETYALFSLELVVDVTPFFLGKFGEIVEYAEMEVEAKSYIALKKKLTNLDKLKTLDVGYADEYCGNGLKIEFKNGETLNVGGSDYVWISKLE